MIWLEANFSHTITTASWFPDRYLWILKYLQLLITTHLKFCLQFLKTSKKQYIKNDYDISVIVFCGTILLVRLIVTYVEIFQSSF